MTENKNQDHEDVRKMKEFSSRVSALFEEYSAFLMDVLDKGRELEYTAEEMVDLSFFMRNVRDYSREMKVESSAKMNFLARLICKILAEKMMAAGPDTVIIARGRYASGSPDAQQKPDVPGPKGKGDAPERYAKLCRFFGVTDEFIEKGVIRFHYPTLTEIVTERAREGMNPPEGIIRTYPEFQVNLRRID